jgi:uncharacterized protein YjbI with pentapeptide repeats
VGAERIGSTAPGRDGKCDRRHGGTRPTHLRSLQVPTEGGVRTTTTNSSSKGWLLWSAGAAFVCAIVMAATSKDPQIAATVGVLVLLGTIGFNWWRAAADPRMARSNLGTGLLVGILVATTIGATQLSIDRARETAARKAADQLHLRTSLMPRNLEYSDLHGLDMTGIRFVGKNLRQASFVGATLVDAHFEDAKLQYAEFQGAELRQATLFGANLKNANLAAADLRDADARDSVLRGADLRAALLSKARLTSACLRKALLAGADLRKAKLGAANLHGANLDIADLENSDISVKYVRRSRTDLRGTDLRGADLRGANLRNADLRGANLDIADLRGADLRGAAFVKADLSGAFLNSRTRLPEGIAVRGAPGPPLRVAACGEKGSPT